MMHTEKKDRGKGMGVHDSGIIRVSEGKREGAKKSIWISNGWKIPTSAEKYNSTYSRSSKNTEQNKKNHANGHHCWKPMKQLKKKKTKNDRIRLTKDRGEPSINHSGGKNPATWSLPMKSAFHKWKQKDFSGEQKEDSSPVHPPSGNITVIWGQQ